MRFPLGRHAISLSSRTIVGKRLPPSFPTFCRNQRNRDLEFSNPLNLSIDIPLAYIGVGVDSTISQKGPMGSLLFQLREVNLDDQGFFLVRGRLPDDLSGRVRDEALSPELNPVSSARRFVSCSVRYRHKTAVGDRMGSLNRFPGGMLPLAIHLFFARMPADRSRIKKDFGAAERSQPSTLRVPLVPTNQHANRGKSGFPGPEPEIARSEIEFLVKERVVWDMHFPILSQIAAVRIDDCGRIVVKPCRAPFEYRRDDDYAEFLGDLP